MLRLLNVSINEILRQSTYKDETLRRDLALTMKANGCLLERKTAQGVALPYLIVYNVPPTLFERIGDQGLEIDVAELDEMRFAAIFVSDHHWHRIDAKQIQLQDLRLFVSASFPLDALFGDVKPYVINAPTASYSEVWRTDQDVIPILQLANGEMHFALGPEELLAWFCNLPALPFDARALDRFPIMRSGELPRLVGYELVRWDLFAAHNSPVSVWLLAQPKRTTSDFYQFEFFRFATHDEPEDSVTLDRGASKGKDRFVYVPKRKDAALAPKQKLLEGEGGAEIMDAAFEDIPATKAGGKQKSKPQKTMPRRKKKPTPKKPN